MSFSVVEIGRCCDIVNGSTPSRNKPEFWGGDIDWFTPKDLSGLDTKYVKEAPEKITAKGYKSCSTTLVPSGSLLYTSRAPIGHLAINLKEVCTNQGFKTLVPKEGVHIEYLYYVLKKFTPNLQALGNGATFKELSKATVSGFKIPLPPLDEQKKIASILDAADAYRQKTKALIEKYDELTQSLFLDMFGDPVTNPKGWEVNFLDQITSKIGSGATPRGGKQSYKKEGISLIRSMNVYDNYFKYKDLAYIDTDQADKLKNVIVEKGDVLFNITGASICRSSVVPDDILPARVNQHVSIIRPIMSKVTSKFLSRFLISDNVKTKLLGVGSGGGAVMEAITKEQLQSFEVIVPPLELQKQFAERVQAIEEQKAQAQASLAQAEDLFNSLLQRAFKGELTA